MYKQDRQRSKAIAYVIDSGRSLLVDDFAPASSVEYTVSDIVYTEAVRLETVDRIRVQEMLSCLVVKRY
jgi:hypothetical protein